MSAIHKGMRKGILLAGGNNSRLYPSTRAVAKSLFPIYDKPLLYYSLAALMFAGNRDILIITTQQGQAAHQSLLGNGERFGIHLSYLIQEKPRGIADAFLIGRDFIAGAPCQLMLCDNIFYGKPFARLLQDAAAIKSGAVVFAKQVHDPQRFGIVEFDSNGKALSLEEKPQQPKSSYAVTGCYFYDEHVCDYAATLTPSARGELEITDINRMYLENNALNVQQMDDDIHWFDTGNPDSMLAASNAIYNTQQQEGILIACLEEIAWQQGWISDNELKQQATELAKTPYGEYLLWLTK